ncbi:hypothetical protein P5G51_016795 [Virgibacillus sp. 179-BFC.A HS]|uniref:3-methyladenine DNA glycosylase n=1 Tax=Tigheibacillus jepli TaxID=3035914 RepID=A0ABU5CLL6_9BACI|nr:hypothetical protein [Virgibacillus sp. 179-BFC.A HS]MDY0406796.1 hypothetical protein [Virgibacillus sp. 179-BFC.A HS]
MKDKEEKYTAKSYQETSEDISKNEKLQHEQPTPQPKDLEEIDY